MAMDATALGALFPHPDQAQPSRGALIVAFVLTGSEIFDAETPIIVRVGAGIVSIYFIVH